MSIPKETNITIPQSTDYNLVIYCLDSENNPVDLTGYSANLTIKRTYQSDAIIEASTDTGEIVVVGLEGKLTVSLTNTQTALLPDFLCVYSLTVTSPDSQILMLLSGKVKVILSAI